MKIEQVRLLSPVDRFCYWISERESIRLKRAAGEPAPWTDDEILQRFRFCNVRRMDDRVSQWLLENWYEPYFGHPNMSTAIILARQLNRIETMEEVGFPDRWNPKRVEKILNARVARGEKNFSAAYMITGTLGGTKIQQIVWKVVDALHQNKPTLHRDSLEDTWRGLLPYAGFSSFIAGQFVADLRWAVNGTWSDKNSWAPMGPGSRRGINRLAGRDLNFRIRQEQFLTELENLRGTCLKKLPVSITDRMELMDWQNCLCEFDKYTRTLLDGRRPKQLYRGGV